MREITEITEITFLTCEKKSPGPWSKGVFEQCYLSKGGSSLRWSFEFTNPSEGTRWNHELFKASLHGFGGDSGIESRGGIRRPRATGIRPCPARAGDQQLSWCGGGGRLSVAGGRHQSRRAR